MLGRGHIGVDAHDAERIVLAPRNAPVAARDHAGRPSAPHQDLEDLDHERRLARAADGDVADDDHGNTGTPGGKDAGAVAESPHRDREPEKQAEGEEHERPAAKALPLRFKPRAHLALGVLAQRRHHRFVCVVNEMWL